MEDFISLNIHELFTSELFQDDKDIIEFEKKKNECLVLQRYLKETVDKIDQLEIENKCLNEKIINSYWHDLKNENTYLINNIERIDEDIKVVEENLKIDEDDIKELEKSVDEIKDENINLMQENEQKLDHIKNHFESNRLAKVIEEKNKLKNEIVDKKELILKFTNELHEESINYNNLKSEFHVKNIGYKQKIEQDGLTIKNLQRNIRLLRKELEKYYIRDKNNGILTQLEFAFHSIEAMQMEMADIDYMYGQLMENLIKKRKFGAKQFEDFNELVERFILVERETKDLFGVFDDLVIQNDSLKETKDLLKNYLP